MDILSWNVNGIRAVLKKGFYDFVSKENPDVICLQETKARPEQVDIFLEQYPYQFWNAAEKKGYSGTAVFSKIEPMAVMYGMGLEEHDGEGRIIVLEFEQFFLINVYTPNAGRGLERLNYRKEWDDAFRDFVKGLEETKLVIICGDLNVAHQEIDLKNPQFNKTTASRPGNAGFTDIERAGMDMHLKNGLVDVFRFLYPERIAYTWWSYMFNARAKDIGWRIDYFLVSKNLKSQIQDIIILKDVLGSDHCPVKLVLK